jgi:hypothetical protein
MAALGKQLIGQYAGVDAAGRLGHKAQSAA